MSDEKPELKTRGENFTRAWLLPLDGERARLLREHAWEIEYAIPAAWWDADPEIFGNGVGTPAPTFRMDPLVRDATVTRPVVRYSNPPRTWPLVAAGVDGKEGNEDE